jgi:uncharacterized membrane protein
MPAIIAYSVPLHPSVVHFPIVLLIIYAVFELAAAFTGKEKFYQTAFIFLAAGVVGLLAAAITGNYSAQIAGKSLGNSVTAGHELIAGITIWFYILWTVVRGYIVIKKRKAQIPAMVLKYAGYVSVIIAITGCVLIFLTAKEGGDLVFKKGIGTEMMQNQSSGLK